MKVVITSATEKEVLQIKQTVAQSKELSHSGLHIQFHISGPGLLSATYAITKMIFEQKPDLIIQAGIAGAFDTKAELGKVVAVKKEYLGDTGVEEHDIFNDIFDLNLSDPDAFPFSKKSLLNEALDDINFLHLEEVTAVTVNEVTTKPERVQKLIEKYNPSIESMEGAALHYCSLQTLTPFIQLRAVSNYIGERDKSKWKFNEAFNSLHDAVRQYLYKLEHYL